MNAHPALISWAIYLLLNLTLLGASLALGVTMAFRFIPTSLPRTRYFITLAAFCAASLLPILATMGITVRQPASLTPPTAASRTIASDHANLMDLAPAIEPASPASAGFRHWLPDFARRLKGHPLAAVLLWLWLSVAILLLGRELIGHLSLWRARRQWELAAATLRQELNWPSHIQLYLHQHSGPSTVGWLRPVVVLPERLWSDLPSTAISQVAQHELAHARWRDPLVNALLRIMRALLWPSLPLWFLEHLTYTEREAAADQAAIADRLSNSESKQSALDYAASLVSIAEWRQAAVPHSFRLLGTQAGGSKALENRVYRLLKTSPRLHPVRLAMGLVTLLGGLVGMGWLPVAVADQPAKLGRLGGTDKPVAAVVAQSSNSQAWVPPKGTNRGNDPATFNRGRVPDHPTPIPPTATEEIEKPLPARAAGGTQTSARKEITPPYPNNTVIFNGGGVPGSAVLIRQTDAGQIEEPILNRSEAETRASALEQVTPSYPVGLVSESRFTGVMVFILIDEDGEVFSARAIAGNKDPVLQERAVEAARQWKFTPATREGKPIKVVGTLTFFGSLDRSRGWVEIR